MHLQAILKYLCGDYKSALSLINDLVSQNPNAAHLNSRANINDKLGRYAQAEEDLQQALNQDPNLIEAYHNLGKCQKKLDKFTVALATIEKGLALDPNHAEMRLVKAQCLYELERHKDSKAILGALLVEYPNYLPAQMNLADVYIAIRDYAEAEKILINATKLHKDNSDILNNLAECYRESGELKKALPIFIEICETNPGNSHYQLNLSNCLVEMGKFAECEERMSKFIERGDGDERAILNLLLVMSTQQEWKKIVDFTSTLSRAKFSDKTEHEIIVYQSLAYWILGEWSKGMILLSSIEKIAQSDEQLERMSFERSYAIFLSSLYKMRKPTYEEQPSRIVFLGESHCLPPVGMTFSDGEKKHRIESRLVIGCKMWHLVKPLRNRYYFTFMHALETIPKDAEVIITIGEIDCRATEGIILQCKKDPKYIENGISVLTQKYMELVSVTAKNRFRKLGIMGIPAVANLNESIAKEDINLQVKIIQRINEELKGRAKQAEINFIDVFALTNRGDGIAKDGYHLDNVHLKPKVYETLWCKHQV